MSFTCLENAMNDLLDSYIDDYNKYLIPDSADIQLSLEDVDFNERAFITHLIGPASEFSFIPEQDYASLCSAIEYQDAFDKLRPIRESGSREAEEKWEDVSRRCFKRATEAEEQYKKSDGNANTERSSAKKALELYPELFMDTNARPCPVSGA